MRTFTLGTGPDRKFVVIEIDGPRMRVIQGKSDGTTKRSEKELASEAEARAASGRMAAELVSRGFVEKGSSAPAPAPAKAKAARPTPATSKAAFRAIDDDGLGLDVLSEAADGDAVEAEAILPRLAATGAVATAEAAPKKKKAGRKKKKKAGHGDGLDKRVVAGFVAVGVAFLGILGFLGYQVFFKPPSIVGHWEGSKTEHEIGRFLTNTQYRLVLDGQKHASMTMQEKFTSTGTYDLKGGRLKLNFKDEDGEVSETEYKVVLGRSTLDLFDPSSGKKVVQLIRFRNKPVATASAKPAEAPKDLGVAPVDKAADDRLASVEFVPKDGAFRLRYPPGWEVETGSRPDNMYSWARFTEGSAKIQVFADTAGSLMAGSDQGQHEEGSELAPVHGAHERYAKNAAELYGTYKESTPALFKGSGLGEGRVATFNATGSGLLGSKLRGLRVTFLSNDRRISILCEAPTGEFEPLKPTFLALCRSLSR